MTPPARCLLVGGGSAARSRVRALSQLPRLGRLVGLVSQDPEKKAGEMDLPPEVDLFTHLAEALSRLRPDVVLLCHPNAFHASDSRISLLHGADTLVEYPLSLSSSDSRELFALAHTLGRRLHVEHIELRTAAQAALRRERREMGTVRGGGMWAAVPCPAKESSWLSNPQLAGFPSFSMISRLTRLLDLTGPLTVEDARFQEERNASGMWNSFTLEARLTCGWGAQIGVELTRSPRVDRRYTRWSLTLEDGSLECDGTSVYRDGQPVSLPSQEGLFLTDLRDFLAWRQGGPPPMPGEEFVQDAMDLAEAIALAAEWDV